MIVGGIQQLEVSGSWIAPSPYPGHEVLGISESKSKTEFYCNPVFISRQSCNWLREIFVLLGSWTEHFAQTFTLRKIRAVFLEGKKPFSLNRQHGRLDQTSSLTLTVNMANFILCSCSGWVACIQFSSDYISRTPLILPVNIYLTSLFKIIFWCRFGKPYWKLFTIGFSEDDWLGSFKF